MNFETMCGLLFLMLNLLITINIFQIEHMKKKIKKLEDYNRFRTCIIPKDKEYENMGVTLVISDKAKESIKKFHENYNKKEDTK